MRGEFVAAASRLLPLTERVDRSWDPPEQREQQADPEWRGAGPAHERDGERREDEGDDGEAEPFEPAPEHRQGQTHCSEERPVVESDICRAAREAESVPRPTKSEAGDTDNGSSPVSSLHHEEEQKRFLGL